MVHCFCTGDDKNKGEKRVIANWGDTLWSLADKHHVTADDIRWSNNLPLVLLPCNSQPYILDFPRNVLPRIKENGRKYYTFNQLFQSFYLPSVWSFWIVKES